MKNHNSMVLVMEVSQGCQHSCSGCMISKFSNWMPDPATMTKLLKMFQEMDSAGMDFYEIELGPTDMLSASNRDVIFYDKSLRELASLFKITTVNASFIHPKERDYIQFAKDIHSFTPNNWVGLAIPIEMSHVFNDKYISRIRENVRVFQQHLPNFLKEVVLTVIFDDEFLSRAGSKYTYEDLFKRTNELSVHDRTMVDFVFHHGRRNVGDPYIQQCFKEAIAKLNEQYLKDIERRGSDLEYRHAPAQLLPESHNNELVYHQGELYIRPVLNERVALFHEHMQFQGDWSLENFRLQSHDRWQRNLEFASTHDECMNCNHQVECASNYVHDLMKVVNYDHCPLIKRELEIMVQPQIFSV